MSKKFFLISMSLFWIAYGNTALSSDLLDDWGWAKTRNGQDLSPYTRTPTGRAAFWYNSFKTEKKRLMAEPVAQHRFSLDDLDEPQRGVSLYGKIYASEKLKTPMTWAFRFHEDKRVIIQNLPGDRWGTRLLVAPYGDVVEIPESEAIRRFGTLSVCHPSRVFLIQRRIYE